MGSNRVHIESEEYDVRIPSMDNGSNTLCLKMNQKQPLE